MEHQTRYDLNAEIENWREELASQPGLTPGIQLELETHLRDAVGRFEQQGLSTEEAFWLARRRIGQPEKLREEFAKANPAAVWRERLFWMTLSLVGTYVFVTWKDILGTWVDPDGAGWMDIGYLIPVAVLIASVVMIRWGKVPSPARIEGVASWKLVCGMLAILTSTVAAAYYRGRILAAGGDGSIGGIFSEGCNIGMFLSWLGNAVWPAVMVMILLFTLKRSENTISVG